MRKIKEMPVETWLAISVLLVAFSGLTVIYRNIKQDTELKSHKETIEKLLVVQKEQAETITKLTGELKDFKESQVKFNDNWLKTINKEK